MADTDKPSIYAVAVSAKIFKSLHQRFDAGEAEVYTGRKDGTNRRIFRKPDGSLCTETGDMVMELTEEMRQNSQPLSRHGQLLKQHGHPRAVYDKSHQLVGYRFKNGEMVPPNPRM